MGEANGAVKGARIHSGVLTATVAFALTTGSIVCADERHAREVSARGETPIHFEIVAQPLAAALDAYARATGLQVLYDSDLAAGRRSTAVSGVVLPDVALLVLLEGTGLDIVYSDGAFAISPTPPKPRVRAREFPFERSPYLALVQAAIERAFCRQGDTMPGAYRAVVRFQIGAGGEVLLPRLLGSSGNSARDRSITDLFSHLRIERSPPSDMPQPLTLIVSPRQPARSGDCVTMRASQ